MKKFYIILCLIATTISSCIKDEAPNAEADIVSCTLKEDVLKRPPIIENNKISLMVNKETDLSSLTPIFELTPGATINPPSNESNNFIIPQVYTVTSEDGKWKKEYTIYVTKDKETITSYTFNSFISKEEREYYYHIIQETDDYGAITLEWASGNSGFVTAAKADNLDNNDPTLFPTYSSEDGRNGRCAKMVTRKPKSGFVSIFAPIAAGNLFIGTFGEEVDITKPAVATHFGEGNIFPYYPLSIEGYYKYKAGPKWTVKNPQNGTDYENTTDTWDIYGVLYDAAQMYIDTQKSYLDGYNVLTSPYIVMIARLPRAERKEASEWTPFYIPFKEFEGGTPLDIEKLKRGDYNLAIVMSSSEEGAIFNGAENSTLCVDDVELKFSEDF